MQSINYVPPLTVKEFIKFFLPGQLFYSWVVGPLGCLPGDSEFLTPQGWKRMDAYKPGDLVAVHDGSGTVAFEKVTYVKLPSTAPFHVFDSGSLKMELSPEHKVLYDDYRNVRRVETAAVCARHPSRRMIPTTFNIYRPDASMSDVEIKLRIAFSADGHTPPSGKTTFTFRKDRKKIRLRELMREAEMEWSEDEYDGRPGERIFRLERQDWTKSLSWVWGLSQRQLGVVLAECLLWDGLAEHEEYRYFTSDKANADVVQFAAHVCGRRATITLVAYPDNPDWKPTYTVQIRTGDNPKNRAMIRAETRISERVSEDGFKYCFTTSTGYFVARCRDTVFVTGNSGKTTGNFMKLVYLARLQQRGPDGVRRSRCVIVRNTGNQLKDTTIKSWFSWFKDGEAGKWFATEKNFVLRFADVECEVMFRPLDTPEDVARVLSLEVTFAIIDEFIELPKEIIDALAGRCGRYPAKKDGGATNFGMWGSSNPGTEDNWWYDYLHNLNDYSTTQENSAKVQMIELFGGMKLNSNILLKSPPAGNVRYFHQPPGDGIEAENVENLPAGYYANQMLGKAPAWVEQFVRANWGFSASETPVIKTFQPSIHVAKHKLKYSPLLRLAIGLDPGMGGMAAILGQEDLYGRLLVMGEVGTVGVGAERFCKDKLKPYLRAHFPDAEIVVAPDPAAANRQMTDERTVVYFIKQVFGSQVVSIETNNRLAIRLTSIEAYTTKITEVGPALLIDQQMCPMLIRALGGGWRYQKMTRHDQNRPEPEKNSYSHYGDGFGYLCRYYQKQFERSGQRGLTIAEHHRHRIVQQTPRYHFR